jgi:ParB family chromosome partitioning protein
MDLQVPLNRLKFGQDDGAGINARVAGRDSHIAELAANLHANGQIENLIVKDAGERLLFRRQRQPAPGGVPDDLRQ